MKIATLFDGAGLARLGLEQAGHTCTGYELDPAKHYLSQFVGSGNSVLADATTVDLSQFDAIWASPPCQVFSSSRTQGEPQSKYSGNFLQWCLDLVKQYPDKVLWVENVIPQGRVPEWGTAYNAAQFQVKPVQNRCRMIGGNFLHPFVYRHYQRSYDWIRGLCPTITATEYKGCATDERRASRFYGRKLTLEECAYHQGFKIPEAWQEPMSGYTTSQWMRNLYEAVGNGVPVYMAKAFGEAYTRNLVGVEQAGLWIA